MTKKTVVILLLLAFVVVPVMQAGVNSLLGIEIIAPNFFARVVYETVTRLLTIAFFVLLVSVWVNRYYKE